MCLSVCLSVCLCVSCVFVCLSVCLCVCLYVCLSAFFARLSALWPVRLSAFSFPLIIVYKKYSPQRVSHAVEKCEENESKQKEKKQKLLARLKGKGAEIFPFAPVLVVFYTGVAVVYARIFRNV